MIYINKKTIDDYLISGDTLYQSIFGNITFPLGTYAVQETKAPTGYLLNEEVFVKNITSDSTNEAVSTYNAPTIPEQIKRGDFERILSATIRASIRLKRASFFDAISIHFFCYMYIKRGQMCYNVY